MFKKKKIDYNNMIIENNPLCADCSINLSSYISVNNGITLCKECSLEHNKYFKKSISFIINLNENIIEKNIYSYFELGGNASFKNNLFELGYDLTNKNIEQKYKSIEAYYYRKKLNKIIHGIQIENFSDFKNNLISENDNNDDIEKDYPEFIPYILGKCLKKNNNFIEKIKDYSINTSKKLYQEQNIAWKITKNQLFSFKNWIFKTKKTKNINDKEKQENDKK